MTFIIVVLQVLSSRFTNLSPVRVLKISVQSAFYKFESSPRFTNLSPVRVLQHAHFHVVLDVASGFLNPLNNVV